MNRDSGTMWGRGTVSGRRASVGTVLYMGALVGNHHNSVIRSLYRRLLAAGRPKRLAMTVCTCRLLTMLNGIVKHDQQRSPHAIGHLHQGRLLSDRPAFRTELPSGVVVDTPAAKYGLQDAGGYFSLSVTSTVKIVV